MIERPDEGAGRLGFCQFCGAEISCGEMCVTLRMNAERFDDMAGDPGPGRIRTTVLGSETVALLCAGCSAGLDGFRLRHLLDKASAEGSCPA